MKQTYQLLPPSEIGLQVRPTLVLVGIAIPSNSAIRTASGLVESVTASQHWAEPVEHWLLEGVPEGVLRLAPAKRISELEKSRV